MLEIKNLTKSYGDSTVKAVDDLSISLNAGEIYGFLGPNGAGKSTTIKCLVGIYPFAEGDILIDGVSIKSDPLGAKMNVGYVSDNHAVFERLTGREYVDHIANLYHVKPEEAEERTERLLDIFKLRAAFDRPIKSYSHGMKQKVSVIGALVHNPKLWVLDEPLTGLDPQSAYQLKQVMKQHAAEGNTVFFSSHILDVVENLCTRCCIIKSGRLEGVYDLKELKSRGESLEEIFMSVIGEIEEVAE
ncbi:MAG: ABC transporter ATP-binding protein [Clostridia bacterium]|nr:ABC transporter ATP-binding protein [Clostridia bacterium]